MLVSYCNQRITSFSWRKILLFNVHLRQCLFSFAASCILLQVTKNLLGILHSFRISAIFIIACNIVSKYEGTIQIYCCKVSFSFSLAKKWLSFLISLIAPYHRTAIAIRKYEPDHLITDLLFPFRSMLNSLTSRWLGSCCHISELGKEPKLIYNYSDGSNNIQDINLWFIKWYRFWFLFQTWWTSWCSYHTGHLFRCTYQILKDVITWLCNNDNSILTCMSEGNTFCLFCGPWI